LIFFSLGGVGVTWRSASFVKAAQEKNKSVPARSNILNTAQAALKKRRAHNSTHGLDPRGKTEFILFHTFSLTQLCNL
jgi:hypothetical protein